MCVYYICIHCMYTYWVHTYLDARIHTVKLCGYLHMVHVISLCVCGGYYFHFKDVSYRCIIKERKKNLYGF